MDRQTYLRRIGRMQSELKQHGVDVALFADRENLIYYTGMTNFDCLSMVIPAEGEPRIVCLWLDAQYVRSMVPSEHVTGYLFPATNLGTKTAEVIRDMGYAAPRIGFGKYFVEFSVFDSVRKALPAAEYVGMTTSCYKVRAVKDGSEISLMRRAGRIVVEGMKAAIDAVAPGRKEVEVAAEAEYAMGKAGSQGSPFRMQVLVHERQLLTHPFAGEAVIGDNQPVVIHLGATYEGYVAKMCRTVAVGRLHPETERIYDVLVNAQRAAIQAVRPPVPVQRVYDAAYRVIDEAGYGKNFLDFIGYGIGIRQSEFYPIIDKSGDHVIEQNMVIDMLLPTVYKPGVGGPRLTDTLLVTGEGIESLTSFPAEMARK
jgi:Xaa-Pro dipeptidase